MQSTIAGRFAVQDLGGGLWQLTDATADPTQIYLRIAAPTVPPILRDGGVTRLDLDWRNDDVSATITSARGASRLTAETAIVHEPQSRLYEQLPLASLDRNAGRFWQRVFTLMRIPGGRFLLKFIARQRR